MFLLTFELKEGETLIVSSANRMYCTTLANQLKATDGGVYNGQDLTKYSNIIYLFKDELIIPETLKEEYSIIYFDISKLTYDCEYWDYLNTTQSLLQELEKLLPLDNPIRLLRSNLRNQMSK